MRLLPCWVEPAGQLLEGRPCTGVMSLAVSDSSSKLHRGLKRPTPQKKQEIRHGSHVAKQPVLLTGQAEVACFLLALLVCPVSCQSEGTVQMLQSPKGELHMTYPNIHEAFSKLPTNYQLLCYYCYSTHQTSLCVVNCP